MRQLLFSVLVVIAACSDNKPPSQQHNDASMPGIDAGVTDTPQAGGADASCFMNPTTHLEIINACTTATAIYKDSHPPLTLADGGLPPLP